MYAYKDTFTSSQEQRFSQTAFSPCSVGGVTELNIRFFSRISGCNRICGFPELGQEWCSCVWESMTQLMFVRLYAWLQDMSCSVFCAHETRFGGFHVGHPLFWPVRYA